MLMCCFHVGFYCDRELELEGLISSLSAETSETSWFAEFSIEITVTPKGRAHTWEIVEKVVGMINDIRKVIYWFNSQGFS